jgi:hypothetical protein
MSDAIVNLKSTLFHESYSSFGSVQQSTALGRVLQSVQSARQLWNIYNVSILLTALVHFFFLHFHSRVIILIFFFLLY